MADLLQAVWKVTLAGTVLLDFTDAVETEAELVPARPLQSATRLRAAFLAHFARGNVRHSLKFTRVVVCADIVSARNLRLAATATAPWGLRGDCTIQVAESAGIVGTLHDALLAENGFHASVEANLFKAAYEIVGGEFTVPD